MGVIMLLSFIWLGILFAAACKMQEIVEKKGWDERYWAWCFWLGPIGWVMVLSLPDNVTRKNQERIISLLSNGADINSLTSETMEDISSQLPNL